MAECEVGFCFRRPLVYRSASLHFSLLVLRTSDLGLSRENKCRVIRGRSIACLFSKWNRIEVIRMLQIVCSL
jgi:hypothetical protein